MNAPSPFVLKRALGLWGAVAVGLGAIIGAGIFVVTGEAAGIAGPSFLIGLLIAGTVAAFNGISSAQLAAVYPVSGGTYEYGYQLLHPLFGFSAGWMFVISKLSAAAVVAIGFGAYCQSVFPEIPRSLWSIGAVVILTLANCSGIKKAGMLNMIIVSITLIALIYFVIAGIPVIRSSNFEPFAPTGLKGIAASSALLFFAFTGYARIATLAEEIKDPERTIPRAVIITILIALILYCAVALVAVGSIGAPAMAATDAPLQSAAKAFRAPLIEPVILLGATTAMLGVLLSQILGISRMLFAMGRRNDLPAILGKVNSQRQIPLNGILITGLIVLLLALTGSIDLVLQAATFSILLYYTITNLAALQQPKAQQYYGRWVPALGLIGCVLMSLSMPGMTILIGMFLLLAGILFRWIFGRR